MSQLTDSAVPVTFPNDADIDGVLNEFGGDPRAAIAALLRDLATLAEDYDGSVSRGFVREAITDAPGARRLQHR